MELRSSWILDSSEKKQFFKLKLIHILNNDGIRGICVSKRLLLKQNERVRRKFKTYY